MGLEKTNRLLLNWIAPGRGVAQANKDSEQQLQQSTIDTTRGVIATYCSSRVFCQTIAQKLNKPFNKLTANKRSF